MTGDKIKKGHLLLGTQFLDRQKLEREEKKLNKAKSLD